MNQYKSYIPTVVEVIAAFANDVRDHAVELADELKDANDELTAVSDDLALADAEICRLEGQVCDLQSANKGFQDRISVLENPVGEADNAFSRSAKFEEFVGLLQEIFPGAEVRTLTDCS